MLVGLHNHTCFSDGRYSPAALVAQAEALGYERLAITDHNSVAGWQSLESLPAWVVPGIELSTLSDGGTEVHILGLWLEPQGRLLEHTRTFQDEYNRLWRDGIQDATGDADLATLAFDPTTRDQVIDRLGSTVGALKALHAWAAAHSDAYLSGSGRAYPTGATVSPGCASRRRPWASPIPSATRICPRWKSCLQRSMPSK